MLEVRRLSGAVISFDGRVVEVLGRDRASTRIHISALAEARISEDGDGRSVVLDPLGIVMPLATTETSPPGATWDSAGRGLVHHQPVVRGKGEELHVVGSRGDALEDRAGLVVARPE